MGGSQLFTILTIPALLLGVEFMENGFQQSQCNLGSYSLPLKMPSKLELACLDNPTHWFVAYS